MQTILFDLDGTLTDSAPGIINSVSYAMEKSGIRIPSRDELVPFIGPPLRESFEKYCGFSREEADRAVTYFREYYKEKGIYENSVYEGIPALLETLSACGKTLIVATSKVKFFAEKVLAHFGLSHYFALIAGSEFDGSRVSKEDVITYALECRHIADLSETVMVGDREHDIFGAKKTGIFSVGVLYGYGGYEELRAAGADALAESVDALEKLLLL